MHSRCGGQTCIYYMTWLLRWFLNLLPMLSSQSGGSELVAMRLDLHVVLVLMHPLDWRSCAGAWDVVCPSLTGVQAGHGPGGEGYDQR